MQPKAISKSMQSSIVFKPNFLRATADPTSWSQNPWTHPSYTPVDTHRLYGNERSICDQP